MYISISRISDSETVSGALFWDHLQNFVQMHAISAVFGISNRITEESRAFAWRTAQYRSLQRHCAVFSAIALARLSYVKNRKNTAKPRC